MQKGFAPIFILVGILILAIAAGAYYFGKLPIKPANNEPKACTQEAKQCPDGSFVSRTGPNCEFAPCPSVAPASSDETANWKTYTNAKYGYSVKYPDSWKITREEYDKPVFKSLTQIDSDNSKTLSNIAISVSPKSYNELLKGLEESVKQYNGKSQSYNLDDKILNARRIEFVTGAGGADYVVHVLFNDKSVFDIEANFSNPPDQEDVVLFNQILSTFKFLP